MFDCFFCARSGNQADVPLNYKQCQWSWGFLGNELAGLEMKIDDEVVAVAVDKSTIIIDVTT